MQKIFSYLVCPLCVRCGSLQVAVSFFCRSCEESFLHLRIDVGTRSIEYQQQAYKIRYLLKWLPGESDCLSQIVYLLKSRWSWLAWQYYSNIFYKLISLDCDPQTVCFIPVPSCQHRKTSYHTNYFCHLFSDFCKSDRINCLNGTADRVSQKKLNLRERRGIHFEFREEFTSRLLKYRQIVLVDDIITSGNTLKACIETLKPHLSPSCKIEIIALFSREKI